MKAVRILVAVFTVLCVTAALADSNAPAFEKIKTLSGSWEGTGSNGKPVQVSFRVTSNGSAIMSEITGHEDMISMFHMDGDRLMMTHYCGAGNQPRMIGQVSPDGKTIKFDFLDATNVLPAQGGHMQHLIVTLTDENHHTEEWQFATNDGKTLREVFELTKK